MLDGQLIVGGCVSLTVIVKLQLVVETLVGFSDVHVTVVVPTGKNEPGTGKQVGVAHDSLGVGGG